ncbi:MAG: alpha/beta hydrolase, partial [Clostridia bacterium]|nr:alpha/beta hydrolase [Clostridia bacterium]
LVGGMAIYVSDYYRADTGAITAFAAGSPVDRTVLSDGVIAYGSADAQAGFIFYPGGKVEYTAYEPLMHALASRGVLCVLIEIPFNLAVLDIDAADGVREQYPEVTRWYIGGHSLGGSMAASYLADHSAEFAGLVLLGAYSTADLSTTSLEVLSLFGSEDRVMNAEKYEENKKNLPQGFAEIKIEGGCHAYFGMYGEQDGDGIPSISAEEQIRVTASHILDLMMKGEE